MRSDENSLYNIKSSVEGRRCCLFDIATWKNGLVFKRINLAETGVPVIKIAELNNGIGGTTAYTEQKFSEDVHLKKGDLLFSWSGNPQTSIDIFRFNLEEGWLNQHIFKVTPDENVVDRNYFYFLMKNLKSHFTKIATNKQTTGLGHVTIADIKRMSVIIPSIDVQRKIVSYIKPIDDKIVLNNEINNNLSPHPCYARIAAKQRRQTPKTDECLHTDGKVSDRGGNEETAEQFSSLLVA